MLYTPLDLSAAPFTSYIILENSRRRVTRSREHFGLGAAGMLSLSKHAGGPSLTPIDRVHFGLGAAGMLSLSKHAGGPLLHPSTSSGC
jgi:hypothetical protein